MKEILVATDFSPRSDRAVRRAVLLAKRFGASLTLVHVVDSDRPDRLVEVECKEASLLLQEQAKSLLDIDGVACSADVIRGVAHEELVKAARARGADLVVLGPHRRQALADIFVGTTAERTIGASDRPVLLAAGVPAGFHRNILIAVDLSECSADAVRAVTALGLDREATVSIVHVFEAPVRGYMKLGAASPADIDSYVMKEELRAATELGAFLEGLSSAPVRNILKGDSVALTLSAAARETAADLVVVGTRGRTGVTKLVLGSVAEEVLQVAECDVLAVPPSHRA